MKSHINEYYCLASIKATKVFAKVFADKAVIIFQDDKVKVRLGISVVSRMFKIIQTVNKPVIIKDHDFPISSKIKFIPSVYLIINPADLSNSLWTEQLFIFVRLEYFIRTSSATHMADLESIISDEKFSATLKKEGKVRPI